MLRKDSKPVVVITAGDPAGIGPEIIVKTLKDQKLFGKAKYFVIGDECVFKNISDIKVNVINTPEDYQDGVINLISVSKINVLKPGRPTKDSAISAYKSLEKAVELIKKDFTKIVVTAPVFKKGIIDAGINFIGHTEFFQLSFSIKDVVMSFYGKKLFVGTLTTHVPLSDVNKYIRKQTLKSKISVVLSSLKKILDKKTPSIAVLGLNPHAGEGGKIGLEDKEIIRPICEYFLNKGENIFGPLSADVAFYEAFNGKYDYILGMYHDQVLAPFKMIYFNTGVNVTLGLPFIRTSPDHGTAFDIAGTNTASYTSMVEAIKVALKFYKSFFKENFHEN